MAAIGESPSMVVTALPSTSEIGIAQERVACPSMCTVQAPQEAMPQPNLVPVIFRCSRNTHSSGVLPFHCDFLALAIDRECNHLAPPRLAVMGWSESYTQNQGRVHSRSAKKRSNRGARNPEWLIAPSGSTIGSLSQ